MGLILKLLLTIGMPVLFLISACQKQVGDTTVEAAFSVSSLESLTTDTISFDASASRTSKANRLFYRWDWDGDGQFDTEFLRSNQISHRFLKPGVQQILLEVINSSGLTDTAFQLVAINQGYSPPHAEFLILPGAGNFQTTYTFDASVSFDDEDSVDQLLFRWDLDGNGSWDTNFKHDNQMVFKFEKAGYFEIGLQVKDPQQMTDKVYHGITVDRHNPDLIPNFDWEPQHGTTADTFLFDASSSYYKEKPFTRLFYSWKYPPVYEWTEWDTCPWMYARFDQEIAYPIELRIRDTNYLEAEIHKEIKIYHENLPPNPSFVVGCKRGNIRTQFYFDAWATRDLESTPTQLEIRWDFDGDGNFETPWTDQKTIYHSFAQAGTFKVVLEARDPEGLSDTSSQYVFVSPFTNETGLIFDFRDEQIYGTVKIGNQWWMSENLNFAPWQENKDYVEKMCYSRFDTDPVPWCENLGGLYNAYHATRNGWWHDDVKGICPFGWHIPTKEEWELLVENIGGWNAAQRLTVNGDTDFNALYSGFGQEKSFLDSNGKPYNKFVTEGLNEVAFFWSFKQLPGWPVAQSCWNIALLKDDNKIYPGYSGNDFYLSVRCIKDAE